MKDISRSRSLLKIYDLLYERFGPRHWWPGDTRLEIIIGAILTQNTSWKNVEKAIENLKRKKVLKIKSLSRVSEKRLAKLIKPAGYYNIKSNRIKNFLVFLNTKYKNSLNQMFGTKTQKLRSELLEVKGIGPETADSILLYAGGKPVFVVDAYTKRVFSRHRFAPQETEYEGWQQLFQGNLPKDVKLYNEFHALIVELGKELCRPKNPMCAKCPIRRINHGRRNKRT